MKVDIQTSKGLLTYDAHYTGQGLYRVLCKDSQDAAKYVTAELNAEQTAAYFALLKNLPELAMHHADFLKWKPSFIEKPDV